MKILIAFAPSLWGKSNPDKNKNCMEYERTTACY